MRPRHAAVALVSGALLLLPGCGSDSSKGKPIPTAQANQMIALIRLADSQSAAGTCSGAHAKVKSAQAVLDSLPRSVKPDVRRGLADGLTRLDGLIGSECSGKQTTQTQTTESQTTPTETTQTTETQTTPTQTTETQTTPTQTTQTQTTQTTTTGTTTTPTTTTGNGGTPPPPGGTG